MFTSPAQPVLPVTTFASIVKNPVGVMPSVKQSTVPLVPSYPAAFAGEIARPDKTMELVAISAEMRRI
jgi:hypothetical protein